MTVQQNVAFGLKQDGMAKADVTRRVAEMLAMVQMEKYARRRPHQLSGGQQQRVALARSLAKSPKLLLLDEPMGALDKKLRSQMQLELVNIVERLGVTCVMVTHDQEEAMTMADTIAVMNDGRIEQLGNPTQLYERPRTSFVAGFLGSSNLLSGTIEGADAIRLEDGTVIRADIDGRSGQVAAGVRPEKITIGAGGGVNELDGTVAETAYIGVATQVVVRTAVGTVDVFAQNMDAGGRVPAPGTPVVLSWGPESTFVVDRGGSADEEEEGA
jgi:ABC-type Fe3+/spermidine/putrescine transport system ATPase subunit